MLAPHISQIVVIRAGEEMVAPNAGRVVATVQHPLAIGNGADLEFVGDAVGAHPFAIIVPDHAVPIGGEGAFPRPTRLWAFGSLKVLPESL